MAIQPTGHIFYQDEYDQKYEVYWSTANGTIDITTVIQQPYVWGPDQEAKIINRTLYRKGIVTVQRQVIEILDDGYVIIAEGSSQYYDYIQMNFNCEPGPTDNFRFHLDSGFDDQTLTNISSGSCWADPFSEIGNPCVWCDLNSDGSPVIDSGNFIQWIDCWA